jgi:hypothetical protein
MIETHLILFLSHMKSSLFVFILDKKKLLILFYHIKGKKTTIIVISFSFLLWSTHTHVYKTILNDKNKDQWISTKKKQSIFIENHSLPFLLPIHKLIDQGQIFIHWQ